MEIPCQTRGRFAPSPSGRMHLGNAWTALLAWLSARSQGGGMVLRMEDLDPDRSKERFAGHILEDLAWLGLNWDEGPDTGGPYGPYRQSQRRGYYQQCLDRLDAKGLLYPCYCTRAELRGTVQSAYADAPPVPFVSLEDEAQTARSAEDHPALEDRLPSRRAGQSQMAHADVAQAPHAGEAEPVYAGTCLTLTGAMRAAKEDLGRTPSLRVKVQAGRIEFTDMVLGHKAQDLADECGDFVLRRADGVHAYQLAVVADDAAQRITEVVRGADLLDSTARQIFLYRAFGWPVPAFAHVPLLVDHKGRRLSKRREDVDLGRLRDKGVAPEAIIGYLAWKAGLTDRPRPVKPQELICGFSFSALPNGPVVVAEGWTEEVR